MANRTAKRTALESAGWRVGSAAEFLHLSAAEATLIETKIALSRNLRERRLAQSLSQSALAQRLQSSQSRVAKMEAADATVSVDLLLKALYALGARPREVAVSLAGRAAPTARNRSVR